jgi:hypothetical protein
VTSLPDKEQNAQMLDFEEPTIINYWKRFKKVTWKGAELGNICCCCCCCCCGNAFIGMLALLKNALGGGKSGLAEDF